MAEQAPQPARPVTAGEEVYEAGRPFYWAPEHAPEALEDSEYVDFSPTEAFNQVIEHVRRAAAAALQA
jgi:hypothetical protein